MTRHRRIPTWLAAAMVLNACTDTPLYQPPSIDEGMLDNRIRLTGGFCAEGASSLESFLKIMLIIDRSNSMNVTDPNNQRISAARDLVMRYIEDPVTLELRPGVEIALISFFGDTVIHTRDARGLAGFSDDGPQILFSITQVAQTSSNTGYDKALAQAFLLLNTDMARLSDRARSLSRYETIFLSDGMPFPDNCRGEANSPSAAVTAVERIQALQTMYKVPHRFHTGFASAPGMFLAGNDIDNCEDSDPYENLYNDSLGAETRALLRDMAAAGNGVFTQFVNGDSISFMSFEFADARRIYALSNFVVSNINAVPDIDRTLPDSDGDGLTDDQEALIGTSPYLADTDGDGFNDALEWRSRLNGIDPLDPTDAICDELGWRDTDGDGLRDCEESFVGTLRRTIDTDADGLVDNLEVAFGTNANSATPMQDLQADADADGGANADEIRWHTDPNRDDVAHRSKLAYGYRQWELPVTTGQACYEFEVKNITLASTGSPPAYQTADDVSPPGGWNRIMLYFAQTPYDDPLGDPIYRVACVEARYVEERDLKIPAGGRFEIPARRPAATYRASPVLRPNHHACHASVNQDCGIDSIWCRFNDDGTCSCNRPPRVIGEPEDGVPMGPCPACANGVDDDADGYTDYPYDPDCFDSMDDDETTSTACLDGINDGVDGIGDWPFDPGCDSAYDNDETDPDPLPECADNIDNDNDNAIDYPQDPGCFAAADNDERESATPCADGVDNDGDGLIDWVDNDGDGLVDYPGDPGCFDPEDIDEDGPAVCFFCELFTDNQPGRCDIATGYCKPRSGIPPTGPCQTPADCRGAVCDPQDGRCKPCLRDRDCDEGICDPSVGWCLRPSYEPVACDTDDVCAGACDEALGYCNVDPYHSCRDNDDCLPGDVCSEDRGFCLTPVFETTQCDRSTPCPSGTCDQSLGWCLPTEESARCKHNDECPFGDCVNAGYCDQQTFVFPDDFSAERDCLRVR